MERLPALYEGKNDDRDPGRKTFGENSGQYVGKRRSLSNILTKRGKRSGSQRGRHAGMVRAIKKKHMSG